MSEIYIIKDFVVIYIFDFRKFWICQTNLWSIFHTLLIFCLVWFIDKQVLKTQNVLVFTLLCIGILTALTATTISQSLPVFVDKKCKHNGEKNCDDNHESQKIKAENKCEIDNKNKDSIKRSGGFNDLIWSKETQNLQRVGEITSLPPWENNQ